MLSLLNWRPDICTCIVSRFDASKPGEIAEQVSRDTGAPVCYVRFLQAGEDDTYLSLSAYNTGALAAAARSSAQAGDGTLSSAHLVWGLIVFALLVALVMQNRRMSGGTGRLSGGIFKR